MSKLALAIVEIHRAERKLARNLRGVEARHHSDQDICHLAGDLAAWSDDHVRSLAEHGRHYGLHLSPRTRRGNAVHRMERRVSDLVRHRPEPALLLLVDLRRIHRVAAGTSLDWELLAQGAQAAKDTELLDVATRCHPQTLRQMRWANAMLKELSPQALTG